MKIIEKMLVILTLSISFAFIPGTASALSKVYFTVSNVDLGVEGPYGFVEWYIDDRTAYFIVDAYESVLNGLGDNWGIDKFFFNTDLDLDEGDFELPSGWKIFMDKEAGGFGKFTIENKGTGNSRGDPIEFSINDLPEGADDGNFFFLSADPSGNGYGHFAMHVGGFDPSLNGETSAYFRDQDGISIPDASIMFLLAPSLLALALFSRKKSRT